MDTRRVRGYPAGRTDAAVMAAAQVEPRAFGAIFDRHYDAIHRYLVRRLGTDIGEDIAAQVFCVAFEQRNRYDLDRQDARPWLYGIATNLIRRHYRSKLRSVRAYARSLGSSSPDLPDGDAEARLDAAALGPRLAEAVGSLSANDRETLLLLAWADLTYTEIAEALGIPVGTVRSRINRTRRVVRDLVGLPADDEPRSADG